VGNQYAPSNEHDLHAPYLHAWAGQPWASQEVLRGLQALYRPAPDGLPGNDDTGSLSAWYVWSALGLYPAVAGAPLYVLGSPLFERAVVQVEGGAFEILAPGAGVLGKYVQSATLNGAPWDRAWLPHEALAPGGTLTLRMGEAPAEGWASGPGAAPPSLSTHGLRGFGCGPGA
jgi:putative alpha-1,2-mannosidase